MIVRNEELIPIVLDRLVKLCVLCINDGIHNIYINTDMELQTKGFCSEVEDSKKIMIHTFCGLSEKTNYKKRFIELLLNKLSRSVSTELYHLYCSLYKLFICNKECCRKIEDIDKTDTELLDMIVRSDLIISYEDYIEDRNLVAHAA